MDYELLNWAIAGAYMRYRDSQVPPRRQGWEIDWERYQRFLRIALLADPEINLT